MENVNIEELRKARTLLEQECFEVRTADFGNKETLYDVMGKLDTKGAVDYMEQFLQNWEKYCGTNGINADEYSVSMTFGTYYSGDLYEQVVNSVDVDYIREHQIKPLIDDLVVVDSGVGSYNIGAKTGDEDPTKYADEEFKSFVVSFSEFKELLSERGYELDGIQSFDDVVNQLLTDRYRQPVARISRFINEIQFSEFPDNINRAVKDINEINKVNYSQFPNDTVKKYEEPVGQATVPMNEHIDFSEFPDNTNKPIKDDINDIDYSRKPR